VAAALGKQGITLQNVVVLDEKADTNNLLGRPGQYASKVFFHDARHPKTPDSGDEFKGTVEMFKTSEEAQKRHDYIAEVTSGMPMLLQYQFLHGNALLRLPKAFTPSETEVYKLSLEKIFPMSGKRSAAPSFQACWPRSLSGFLIRQRQPGRRRARRFRAGSRPVQDHRCVLAAAGQVTILIAHLPAQPELHRCAGAIPAIRASWIGMVMAWGANERFFCGD